MRCLLPILLVLLAGCSGCASVPTHDQLRSTTLRLEFAKGYCSATAVARDVLLTASHCLKAGGTLTHVNGQAVKVVAIGRDSKDLATVQVTGITFAHVARFGRPLVQGDRVRWWGTPHGQPDVYREGYVARARTDGVLIVATICGGDSGSGIFNDAGKVVGVVSAMSDNAGCTFTLVWPRDA